MCIPARAFVPPALVLWGLAGLISLAMLSQMLLVLLPATAVGVLAATTTLSGDEKGAISIATTAGGSSSAASSMTSTAANATPSVDLSWHAPANWSVDSLSSAITGTGVYGFIFNSSTLPPGVPYGTYDWCNMPHVRAAEYPPVASDKGLALQYVEVIQRHHKRTPYAANTFPVETYPWYCNDSALFYYGAPRNPTGNSSAATFWSVFTDAANPLVAPGFPGDCEFPQLTRGGLDDAWLHGRDLYGVYHDKLRLIPDGHGGKDGLPKGVTFRVTNNVITSQVAGMTIDGMFGLTTPAPLLIQPDAIDSLEPAYSCPGADAISATYGVGSSDPTWTAHLNDSAGLFKQLDDLSGVDPSSAGWHQSWDHYFDNLSARLCHAKPLPCDVNNTANCVTPAMADEVFRLGEWEYSWMYRGAPRSLAASAASFGIWVAELAANLRAAAAPGGKDKVGVYRHNVAHDGSLSRLLSILQIERMVWPGMGSEAVFELYSKDGGAGGYFVRILWGGQVLKSSSPTLGTADMVPLDTLLAYFDGLVGKNAALVPGKCSS